VASLERSGRDAPATKYSDAGQLIFDLLGSWDIKDSQLSPSPTPKEINQTLKNKVMPKLVQPREGYELDSPSANETISANTDDYTLPSGDEIRILDKEIAYLARHNNIPVEYKPRGAYRTPSERAAFERNQEKIAKETLTREAKPPLKQCRTWADSDDRIACFVKCDTLPLMKQVVECKNNCPPPCTKETDPRKCLVGGICG
jgi:hypothetical protein